MEGNFTKIPIRNLEPPIPTSNELLVPPSRKELKCLLISFSCVTVAVQKFFKALNESPNYVQWDQGLCKPHEILRSLEFPEYVLKSAA